MKFYPQNRFFNQNHVTVSVNQRRVDTDTTSDTNFFETLDSDMTSGMTSDMWLMNYTECMCLKLTDWLRITSYILERCILICKITTRETMLNRFPHDELVWVDWIPWEILTFQITYINEICCLDLVQNALTIILKEKKFLKNHNFFLKLNFKYKSGKNHVGSIGLDVETSLDRFLEHFSIKWGEKKVVISGA